MDNFKMRVIIAIKFEILLYNFKVFKKINVVKAYLFRLFKVYSIDDLIHSTIMMLNKCQLGKNK